MLVLAYVILLIDVVVPLSYNWIKCPADCSRVMCNHYKTLKKFCRYGTIYDHCGCCQVCAMGPGEMCGGPGGVYGKCGQGYYCYPANRRIGQTGRCIREYCLFVCLIGLVTLRKKICSFRVSKFWDSYFLRLIIYGSSYVASYPKMYL